MPVPLSLPAAPIPETIARIDSAVSPAPLGYPANCVHPSILARALDRCDAASRGRILGLQANTSAKSLEQLEGSMLSLHRRFHLRILGGCCGAGARHIRSLAAALVL